MNIATHHVQAAGRRLADRVPIVTGSTSGISVGVARSLAADGAAIVLNGFGPEDEIARTSDSLAEESGISVLYDGADISKPAEIAAMVAKVEAEFCSVDILVNNAGVQHVAPIESFAAEMWDAILAINLSAAFHVIRAAAPPRRQ